MIKLLVNYSYFLQVKFLNFFTQFLFFNKIFFFFFCSSHGQGKKKGESHNQTKVHPESTGNASPWPNAFIQYFWVAANLQS